jgi:transcriptional regulator with XRE-family HTH domain
LKGVFHARREDTMSTAPAVPYGEVIKDYRKRSGISQDQIATITNEDVTSILELEARNAPPSNPAFYPRLLQGTGCINLFVQSVLQAAEVGSSTEELEKLIAPVIESLKAKPKVADVLWRAITAAVPPDPLTKSLQPGANISEKEASDCLKEHPSPIRSHYPHTMPDHGAHLVAEGKWGEKHTDRLITLKEAAALYPDEVSYSDVLRWHYSGLLDEQGRRWLARPGGRSIPLVSQVEVAYLKDNRPPRGPTESFKKKMRDHIDRLKNDPLTT